MPTYSTFSPAKSKTLVIFILLGSDSSSSLLSSFLVSSDFLSGIESKMELTILRGCVDCCCVDLPEDFEACFLGAAAIDVRLPSPPDFGFGFGLAAVSFLKSAHRSSTLLFSSAAFGRVFVDNYYYLRLESIILNLSHLDVFFLARKLLLPLLLGLPLLRVKGCIGASCHRHNVLLAFLFRLLFRLLRWKFNICR